MSSEVKSGKRKDISDADNSDYNTSEEGGPTKKPKNSGRTTLKDLVASINSLITENKQTNTTLTELKAEIQGVKDTNSSIDRKLEDIRTEIETKVSNHDGRLADLENRVDQITGSLNSSTKVTDSLYSEVNKINLILSGLDELINETTEVLIDELNKMFHRLTGCNYSVDHAYRIGYQNGTSPRRIKVRFSSLALRNKILLEKSKLPPGIYLNDDLPPAIRKAQGLLRAKKKELLVQNPGLLITVDWKKLSLKSDSGNYNFIDGQIIRTDHTHQASLQPSSSSRTSSLQPNQGFLAKRL